jgi:hypothetical protein
VKEGRNKERRGKGRRTYWKKMKESRKASRG